jgi:hypothetical protein
VSAVPFAALPDSARAWIFAARRPLDADEAERLLAAVDAHLREWRAHGRPVVGARDWRLDRFLIVGADEAASGVSGCSIDALFRTLGQVERELGVSLRDRSAVHFCDREGSIRSVDRAAFRGLATDGEVDADTAVFDTTIDSVGEVRAGRWELPLGDSWLARLLPSPAG